MIDIPSQTDLWGRSVLGCSVLPGGQAEGAGGEGGGGESASNKVSKREAPPQGSYCLTLFIVSNASLSVEDFSSSWGHSGRLQDISSLFLFSLFRSLFFQCFGFWLLWFFCKRKWNNSQRTKWYIYLVNVWLGGFPWLGYLKPLPSNCCWSKLTVVLHPLFLSSSFSGTHSWSHAKNSFYPKGVNEPA